MANSKIHEQLRQKLYSLWDLYEAIYILVNGATTEIREGFIKSKENIAYIEGGKLLGLISELGEKVEALKKRYGVIAEDEILVKIAKIVKDVSPGKMALIPKYIIEMLFSNYREALRKFDSLPSHIRIGIDPGLYRSNQGTAELYLTEAVLFEDLCAFNNLLIDSGSSSQKMQIKSRGAIVRSLIEACFRFLEAYLNGLAFDYNIKEYDRITEKERAILTEWDYKNEKPRFISFREKIIKYPKIIGGYSEPPITESNCSSLKLMMEKSKIFRDSIVHASPFVEPGDLAPEKELAFYSVSADDAKKTLEATMDLTEIIQNKLRRSVDDLWWFFKPDSTGRFADEVFK